MPSPAKSVLNRRPTGRGPSALDDVSAEFRRTSVLWMACITMLMVPMATLVDVSVARWFLHHPLGPNVSWILSLGRFYSNGTGVFVIVVAIMLFARRSRWRVPRLTTLAMGAGAVATLAKMVVLRPRPNSLVLDATTYDYAWVWSFDPTLQYIASFDAATRAFPSASLATATALTAGLWVIVPKARGVFVAFCIATMLQRLASGAHFVSDLFGSASVGLGWAWVCFHPRLLGRSFDKLESENRPRPKHHHEDKSDRHDADPSGREISRAA